LSVNEIRRGLLSDPPIQSPRQQREAVPFSANIPVLSPLRAVWTLVILLLAAHAPLFLNDSVFMDDWLVLKLRPDYPVDIDFLIRGAGHPVFFGYYSIANIIGAPILVMKIMAIAAILSGAISLFLAATRTDLLSRAEAVGVALLVWIYPGYQMWAGKANTVYVFSFGLFFVGTWLLTLAFEARGARHPFLRIASALIFFLSFALNSLMALYVFAMFSLFVATWRANSGERGPIRRLVLSALRCAAGYPELVVLPLVYWGVLNIWFKRVGAYRSYYGIHLPTFPELRSGWNAFFQMGCMNILARAGQTASDHWTLFALIGVVVIVAFMLRAKDTPRSRPVFQVALPLLLSVLLDRRHPTHLGFLRNPPSASVRLARSVARAGGQTLAARHDRRSRRFGRGVWYGVGCLNRGSLEQLRVHAGQGVEARGAVQTSSCHADAGGHGIRPGGRL
jgi:hypothetical protein